MHPLRTSMMAALLAACCSSALAAGQAANPPTGAGPGAGRQQDMSGPGMRHGPDGRGPAHGPRHGGDGHGRDGRGFGQFRQLDLSEAQQDKLFAIGHAAAPQRRQQHKAVRAAREALRAVREADRFDEAKAGAAARELGQAVAAEALLEARLHAQALAVLTSEQRERLRQRRQQPRRDRW